MVGCDSDGYNGYLRGCGRVADRLSSLGVGGHTIRAIRFARYPY